MTTMTSIVERLIRAPLPSFAATLEPDARLSMVHVTHSYAKVATHCAQPRRMQAWPMGRALNGPSNDVGEAAAIAGGIVEHLVRLFWNPGRLRAAEREHEPHIPVPRIEPR